VKSTYATVAAALLRGNTDEIAYGAQASSGRESIPELIARVRDTSRQAQAQMRSALGAAFPEIGWNDSEDKQDPQAGAGLRSDRRCLPLPAGATPMVQFASNGQGWASHHCARLRSVQT
jgi:hypothetical protein